MSLIIGFCSDTYKRVGVISQNKKIRSDKEEPATIMSLESVRTEKDWCYEYY